MDKVLISPSPSLFTLNCKHRPKPTNLPDLRTHSNRLRGEDSQWFGYLQSLPQAIADLALFWGYDYYGTADRPAVERDPTMNFRLRDSEDAKAWLTNTEVHKEIRRLEEDNEISVVSLDTDLAIFPY
jgi:hypothetical protein